MSRETNEIGITGGKPTLLGDDLIDILNSTRIICQIVPFMLISLMVEILQM